MPPVFFSRLRALPYIMLFAALALAGCQTTQVLDGDKYQQDLEETVDRPYTPRDDGIPLTAQELRAFKTRGKLDANLSQEEAQIVELHFKYFLHERRGTFERFLSRTARFLPYIKQTFAERGIPEEIAYLCMVESGGNPNAISPAGAAGLWQFMPFTGRRYGLKQNTWLDERRDPFKATYAASDYLLKLYADFKDWHLAVAAYNAGEGKIGRAMEGTGAKDFFELCRLDGSLEERARLREETRVYVPRLIAVAKIMRNLRSLGFQEPSPNSAWNLESIDVPPGTNLAGLARRLGLTWDEFHGMNPAYRRTASPPTLTTVAYVPPGQKLTGQTWVASNEARIYAGWKEYTVTKKDTLASVSKRHKISVAALKQANGFAQLPRAGSVIVIPGGKGRVEPVYDALPGKDSTAIASAGKYKVRPGDTLYGLASAWRTDVDSIRKVNRMGKDEDKLSPGQRLSIPSGTGAVAPAAPLPENKGAPVKASGKVYVVESGDTTYKIARKHNVSVQSLCEVNAFARKDIALKIGQKIKLPAVGAQTAAKTETRRTAEAAPVKTVPGKTASTQTAPGSPSAPKMAQSESKGGKTITVARGDTLYALSRKHNITVAALMKANKLAPGSTLRPGQKLLLP